MKKLLGLAALVVAVGAQAAADDINFTQRNSLDTGNITRQPAHPVTGPGVLMYEHVSTLPLWMMFGTGFVVNSGILDLSLTSGQVTGALGYTPYSDANPAGYITSSALTGYLTSSTAASTYATQAAVTSGLAGKEPTLAAGTTAQYLRGDKTWQTLPTASTFNFGFPVAKATVTGTSYQAADPSKAAVLTYSAACANNSTVVAANPCTLTVRMHTAPVTCSTGTVYATLSATVDLGLVITQRNTAPPQINLPAGAHVVFCATAGAWTLTTVEQAIN